MALAARDTVCVRQEVQEFGDGVGAAMVDETCCRGYFYCSNINCGRTTRSSPTSYTRSRSRGRTSGSRTGRTSSSGCRSSGSNSDCNTGNCNTNSDCDSNSDGIGALIAFFAIVAIFLLIIYLAPYFIPLVALGIEFVLAIFFGLFELLSFGIFRKKFRRVLVHFPGGHPDDVAMANIIADAASFGGLTRHYVPRLGSNGFWFLRTGAYLFFPSLATTLLVLYLQPENDYLFRLPIISFVVAIIFVWIGNFLINRKAKSLATADVKSLL
jgi:hypothetical protein